jgi:hypothetical protein
VSFFCAFFCLTFARKRDIIKGFAVARRDNGCAIAAISLCQALRQKFFRFFCHFAQKFFPKSHNFDIFRIILTFFRAFFVQIAEFLHFCTSTR